MERIKKIVSKKYGIIHAYAQCIDCVWVDGIDISSSNRMQKLKNSIYKHIRNTNHTVTLETGTSTDYFQMGKKNE